MTARSYLSIGDVLTLLREEFPDVTISKIRFLESQGLVNPERSPSGYRKFYETDVERLRWVLRQQREHFLPLKVIRDRLDAGDLGEEEGASSEAETHGNGRVPQPAHAAAGARGRECRQRWQCRLRRHRHRDGVTPVARTVARTVVGAVPGRRSGDGADSGRRISAHYPCSRGRRPAALAARHPRPCGACSSGPRGRSGRCSRSGRSSGCEQRRTRHRAVGSCGGACRPGPDRGSSLAGCGTPATARPCDVGCHATRVGAVSGRAESGSGSRSRPGRPRSPARHTCSRGRRPIGCRWCRWCRWSRWRRRSERDRRGRRCGGCGPWKRRTGGGGAPRRDGFGAGGGTGCRRSEGKGSRRGLRKVTGQPECEECRRSVPRVGGL